MSAYKSIETRRKGIFFAYIIMFFAIWTIYQLNIFEGIYRDNAVLYNLIKNSIKYIVWTVPVFLLLIFVYNSDPISYLKLNDNVMNGFIWGISIGLLLVLYHVVINYIMGDGSFSFNISRYTWIHRIILIGLTEEIVFRGFILQRLQEGLEFMYANTISAILFLLIHFPGWYMRGIIANGETTYFLACSAFVLAFGLLQGYVLKRTKSLWACMIIHSFNNLITTIIGI